MKYSDIRGFNYTAAYHATKEQLVREMGYAKRLQLNSVRIWLEHKDYKKDAADFMRKLMQFVDTISEMGITVMPVLFNGNVLDPEILEEDRREEQDIYVDAVVGGLRNHSGVVLWDIMNEPACNDYIMKAQGEEKEARWKKMNAFLKYHCGRIHEKFPDTAPLTIGHMLISDVYDTLQDVDVISFHDYSPTSGRIDAVCREALKISEEAGKPVINSELCCLARANPYDVALSKCEEYQLGWYLFELMIDGYWSDIHGIFYPDGTVRDPSIPAAVMGFYRKRRGERVFENLNKEGHAEIGIEMVKKSLQHDYSDTFHICQNNIEDILEAAEYCANLLEGCQLIPMQNPPTARIHEIREKGDYQGARKLAFELAELLKKECFIL